MRTHSVQPSDQATDSMGSEAALLSQLDDALASIRDSDRQLILLHHLENRPFEEIAAHLRVPIPTAARRTQRAVERLRGWFNRRTRNGGTSLALTTPILTSLLSTQAAHRAPISLAAGAASSTATALAEAINPLLTVTSIKTMTAIAALLLLFASAGYVTVTLLQSHSVPLAPPAPAAPALHPIAAATGEAALPRPGKTRIVQFEVALEGPAAEDLKKLLEPVGTSSEVYAGYRAPTDTVLNVLRAMDAAGRILPPTFHGNLQFNDLNGRQDAPIHYMTNAVLTRPPTRTFFNTFASAGRGGSSSLERSGDSLHIKIDIPSAVAGSNRGSIHYDGPLEPDQTLLFIAVAPPFNAGEPLSHIVLWQAFKATDDELRALAVIDRSTLWIKYGATNAVACADRALAWQRAAPTEPIPEKFSRVLPNGVTVRLVALGDPQDFPFCWWRPDGAPSPKDWTGPELTPEFSGLEKPVEAPHAVVIAFDVPSMQKEPASAEPWRRFGDTNTTSYRFYRSSHAETLWPIDTDFGPIDVGIATGSWTDLATMQGPGELNKGGLLVSIKSIQRQGDTQASALVQFKAPKELEVRPVAVDSSGKCYFGGLEGDFPSISTVVPAGDVWKELSITYSIAPENIHHFLIQTRRRQWAAFTDYAHSPSAPIPKIPGRGR